MKRSSIWFVSILIASALLLSAVRSGSDATPSNQPPANQIEQTPSDHHTAAAPTATLSNTAPETWLAFFGHIATIGSAVLLTLFTGGLWVTSIWQWRVARNALYADRPYLLLLDRPEQKFFDPKSREDKVCVFSMARCGIKNLGKGPAILTNIMARMKLASDLTLPPDFSDCLEIRDFKDPVIEDKAPSEFFVPIDGYLVQMEDWERLRKGETKVVLYGKISYEDVFKNPYVTAFGYVYEGPGTGLGRGSNFRLGRKEYNYRT